MKSIVVSILLGIIMMLEQCITMKSSVVFIFLGIIITLDGGASTSERATWSSNFSCGVDKSPYFGVLFLGVADTETYPWLGTLVYPVGELKITVVVVLVTRQIAVALASSIQKLPKDDFRFRSRVYLGRECNVSVDDGIRVMEYAFPPDYSPANPDIAMLQLDVDTVREPLEFACRPPIFFTVHPELYVISPRDCETGKVLIYKVKLVSLVRCKQYYRKFGKEQDFWPANILCVRAVVRSNCRWREGSALVLKQSGQWSFLGFTLRGSGCKGPARFVDYGAQHQWLRQSVARAGSPAITRIADNQIVMRRSTSNIQRFGPCDPEEQKFSIYTDKITMELDNTMGLASYNLTLIHNMEYSCVEMTVKPTLVFSEQPPLPKIVLQRWCAGPPKICYGFHHTEINYFITIEAFLIVEFNLAVYGRQAEYISPPKALKYSNMLVYFPAIPSYAQLARVFDRSPDLLVWLND